MHAEAPAGDDPASVIMKAGAALSYMTCATALVLFNKAVLSVYGFRHPNVITLLQLVLSTCLLGSLRAFRRVEFHKHRDLPTAHPKGVSEGDCASSDEESGEGSERAAKYGKCAPLWPSWRTYRQVAPLSAAYLVYMVLGMASVSSVNLPMYTTLRQSGAALTLVTERVLQGKRHSPSTIACVVAMVLAAFVAGAHDLTFDLHAYGLVLLSNLSTCVYLVVVNNIGKDTDLSTFGIMWCNGVWCVPALLVLCALSGEFTSASQRFTRLESKGEHGVFQVCLLMSCVLAFALNYTIFLNTRLNGALTQTVCGNMKDMVIIAFGFFGFGGGFIWAPLNVLGIVSSTAASVAYGHIKLREAQRESAALRGAPKASGGSA